MARRRTPCLLLRGGIWHIDKIVYRKRICETTGTQDRVEAEALLARRVSQARQVHLFDEQREHTFREAAAKLLAENQHKRSIERDHRAPAVLDPSIDKLREQQTLLGDRQRIRLAPVRVPLHLNERSNREPGPVSFVAPQSCPQVVTRSGRKTVVIVSADEWDRKTKRIGNLAEFFAASPLRRSRVNMKRSKERARKIDF